MGKHFSLTAADKFQLGAYRADPAGPAKGGIVVIQEIFGVNHHIRAVCDRLASEGYAAVAPALFDRPDQGFRVRLHARRDRQCAQVRRQSGLGRDDARHPGGDRRAQGRRARSPSSASAWAARSPSWRPAGSTGCRAAVAYYGGQIAKFADEKPKVPMMMHFGETDQAIPMTDVDDHQAEARRRQRDLRLSGRRPRLPLRRARQLPRAERQDRLAAHHGLPQEASEEVIAAPGRTPATGAASMQHRPVASRARLILLLLAVRAGGAHGRRTIRRGRSG